MRIRQVKPAFWSDARLSRQPERNRLFYIGLWMIADDAGWLRWDAAQVANELYGYEPRVPRERKTAAMFASLVAAGHVVLHECGHAEIPHLPVHQRLAGTTKQVKTSMNEHLRKCISQGAPQVPAGPRVSPERNGTERSGQERLGTERKTRARGAGAAAARGGRPTAIGAELGELKQRVGWDG